MEAVPAGSNPALSEADKAACKDNVLLLFEDMCQEHLTALAEEHSYDAEAIIAAVLDQQERDIQYPRRQNSRKRKRSDVGDDDDDVDDDGEANAAKDKAIQATIDDPQYAANMRSEEYREMATTLISQDFRLISKREIKYKFLRENDCSLFRTYLVLDDAVRAADDDDSKLPWTNKKVRTKLEAVYSSSEIKNIDLANLSQCRAAALTEFLAARDVKIQRDAQKAAEIAELDNLELAKQTGEMRECGCCFDEVPINRMVHCDGEVVHSFCRACVKQQVETIIGYSKYELLCLSMDGCTSGFSKSQRDAVIDKKLQNALDQIEAVAVLEKAQIENLETCPFCPMAMEYPPVEENKEFRCINSKCGITSCRLCRKKTHIPKSCAEAALDEGHSARHTIEEAMSEAIIRKCNKCTNPYIKQDGCNKITCTRCGTLQCYVCRKTVSSYDHFNDTSRGGMKGQCPLFDVTEDRHQQEVRQAEMSTRERVAIDHPDLNNDALELKMSANVEEDERKRKEQGANARNRHRPFPNHGPRPVHDNAAAAAVDGLPFVRMVQDRIQGEPPAPNQRAQRRHFEPVEVPMGEPIAEEPVAEAAVQPAAQPEHPINGPLKLWDRLRQIGIQRFGQPIDRVQQEVPWHALQHQRLALGEHQEVLAGVRLHLEAAQAAHALRQRWNQDLLANLGNPNVRQDPAHQRRAEGFGARYRDPQQILQEHPTYHRRQQELDEFRARFENRDVRRGPIGGNNMANFNVLQPNQPWEPVHDHQNRRNNNVFAPANPDPDPLMREQGLGFQQRLEELQRHNVWGNLRLDNENDGPNLRRLARLHGSMRPADRIRDEQAAYAAGQAQANQMRDARA